MAVKFVTIILDLLLMMMLMSFVIDARDRHALSRERCLVYGGVAGVLLAVTVVLNNNLFYMLVMFCYICTCIWTMTNVRRIKTVFATMLLTLIAGFPLNTLVFVFNVMGIDLVNGKQDGILSALTALADFAVIFWVYRQRKKYDDQLAIRFSVLEYAAAAFLFMLTTLLGVVLNPKNGELNVSVLSNDSGAFLVSMLTALVVFNNMFFLVMVWRSKTTAYYQHLNALNAQYVDNELQYFERYKQSQEDIRAFRHDMKHHLARMAQLCEAGKTEELAEYLEHYRAEWSETAGLLYQTGDDHVDAILNGRAAQFRKEGFAVTVSGAFAAPLRLSPFDTCAIFANAIDNAIEENLRLSEERFRWLKFTVRKNQQYYVVTLENPLARSGEQRGRTSKDDPRNHGFGLFSIREKTEKNGGSVQIQRIEGVFLLSIFLPI